MLLYHLLTRLTQKLSVDLRDPKRRLALGLLAVGGLLLSVPLLGTKTAPLAAAAFAALFSLLGYALGSRLSRRGRTPSSLSLLETPFAIAHDAELREPYQRIARAVLRISQQPDPIYREAALDQLDKLIERLERIAGGTLVYEGTETWRKTYERLLQSPGVHQYRSVAWVRHAGYWQDEPGLQSLALNYRLQEAGRVKITRIAIVAEELWPAAEELPIAAVRWWLHEQLSHGIDVRLVRQAELAREPDLISDLGIYGSRAVGFQELDPHSRTLRFTLSFDFDRLTAAEERWDRLMIYAASYENLLDRCTFDAYDPDDPAE